MNGYLLVDKPKGWTSFDVVNKVRSLVQQSGLNTTGKKRFPVGHTGTLDPLATGLLVILVGDYTKRAEGLSKQDKTYEVTMKLGLTSTTGDEEGEKTTVSDNKPDIKTVEATIKSFEGESEQLPPIYSAIKVAGQRAYKLARQGKEVKLEPRPIKIYNIDHVAYKYPQVSFTARVSSGTYIRSLVEDIGRKLSTGAYMSNLKRTKIASYDLKDALDMSELSAEQIYQRLRTIA